MWYRRGQGHETPPSDQSLTTLTLANLLSTRVHVTPRELPATSLNTFPGPRVGIRRGQGLEYEDLRQYHPGDDIRHIDWNVTARTHQAHTRIYREEKEHTTCVAVDLRPCMFTGTKILKAVHAGLMASTLLWQASRAGDRCAVITYTSRELSCSRPMSGYTGVLSACELLQKQFTAAAEFAQRLTRGTDSAQTKTSATDYTADPQNSLKPLLHWLHRSRQRTGTQYLISGFEDDIDTEWQNALHAISAQNRTRAIMLTDPIEETGLPLGHYHYVSYQGSPPNQSATIGTSNQSLVRKQLQSLIEKTRNSFELARVPLVCLPTDIDGSEMLERLAHRVPKR